MEEIWKTIKEAPRYEISNLGRVRTWIAIGSHKISDSPRIKKTIVRKRDAYVETTLSTVMNGKPKLIARTIHTLVAKAFVRGRRKGLCAAHLDGNKQNNRCDNIIWATRKENESHKILHGTKAIGEKSGRAKLKESDVREIIRLLNNKVPRNEIWVRYKISPMTVSRIANKETWYHLWTERGLIEEE